MIATRRIQFCSGHRVYEHEGKCAFWHGHNYVAFIHAQSTELDSVGRVIDFSVLKEKVGGWIDRYWDHKFIFYKKDELTRNALKFLAAPTAGTLNEKQPWFEADFNPTAENMASYLLEEICPMLLKGLGVEVVKVVLWETENCFAEVQR